MNRQHLRRRVQTQKKNVFQVFQPLFLISAIAGATTVKCNPKRTGLIFSKLATILCILFASLTLVFLWVLLKFIVNIKNIQDFHTIIADQNLNYKLGQPVVLTTMVAISRFCLLFSDNKRLIKYFNLIQEVDVLLHSTSSILKEDARMMKLIFFVTLILPLPFHFYLLMYSSDGSFRIMLTSFFVRLNYTGFTLVECQFLCFCCLVYKRFKMINKRLKRFQLMTKGNDLLLNTDGIIQNCITISKAIDDFHLGHGPNHPLDHNLARNNDHKILVEDIQRLKIAHMKLTNALANLNLYYNLHLLTSTFVNIFFIIFGLYYSVCRSYNLSTLEIPKLLVFNGILWMMLVLMKIVLICLGADYVTNEGNVTKVLITDFIHRGLSADTKHELINFFEYTIARNEKIVVCGIFILDLSLIAKAVATGITFVILLIQFGGI